MLVLVYCIVGFFHAAKFSCFRRKPDFIHLIFVMMFTMQTMPTLILRLCAFIFVSEVWRMKRPKVWPDKANLLYSSRASLG